MPFTSVLRALGAVFIVMAALAALCAMFAATQTEPGPTLSLSVTAVLALFAGVSGMLIGRNLETETGPREGVALLLLSWSTLPLVSALGFWTQGGASQYPDAFFEAMSAVTTTGFTLMDTDAAPRALILWRAMLEWGGGYFSILTVLVVLVALNLVGPGVHRSTLFTLGGQSLSSRFLHITRQAGIIYLLITAMTLLLLLMSGAEPFSALILAFSSPATGAAAAQSGPLAAGLSSSGLIVVGLSLLAGSLNYALLWESWRDNVMRGDILKDPETRGLVAFVVLLTIALFFVGGAPVSAFHDAIALVSTSARFADPSAMGALPAPLLMGVVLIGGSALSTAGGLKLIRVILLARHARMELGKLSFPSSVQSVRFRDRIVSDRMFVSLWIYFLGFTAVLAALIIAIALTGHDFSHAVAGAVSALSNAGPLTDIIASPDGAAAYNPQARIVMMIGMALGRMEVLAAIVAVAPGLWRR